MIHNGCIEVCHDRCEDTLSFSFQLEKPVMATGNVELWLGKLLDASRQAVHGVVRNAAIAVDDPSFQLLEFLNSFPAQVMTVL